MRSRASRAMQQRNSLIDDAGAGGDRVGRMVFGAVALGNRGGDAALRPQARRAFAERRGGDDGDRVRRELERGEQAGKAAADHNDARPLAAAGSLVRR